MSLLKNRMTATEAAEKKKKDEIRKEHTAIYSSDGKKVQKPFYQRFMGPLIAAGVILILALIIYIPPLFYSEESESTQFMIQPDTAAINTYQMYLKDNPDADFDEDGMTNAMENEYGTDIWNADTDGDGVNDYAEVFLTDTSPVETTSVFSEQMKIIDQENGGSLETPYKIDDIIFWPDSYTYKAFGSVVRTSYGYRFWNYKGWVKFPQAVYAYKYIDGIHYEMEHRTDEDAWYIDSSDEVLLYGSELKFVYRLSLPIFGTVLVRDGFWGYVLDHIFPDKGGIITCYREAEIDETTSYNVSQPVMAELSLPDVDIENPERLGRNMNSLSDLSGVMQIIDSGRCVTVSLYSANVGESIGVIYGYSGEYLYIADQDLNPVGTLKITEMASRQMNQSGEIEQISWYEWSGIGYDSQKYGDRISFVTEKKKDENETVETEPQFETQPVTEEEIETEAVIDEEPEEALEDPETLWEDDDDEWYEDDNADSVLTFDLG